MKSLGQPWCIFPRNKANGILYFQLKDKETGESVLPVGAGQNMTVPVQSGIVPAITLQQRMKGLMLSTQT